MLIKRYGRVLAATELKTKDDVAKAQSLGFEYDETRRGWVKRFDEEFLYELARDGTIQLDNNVAVLLLPQSRWDSVEPLALPSKRLGFRHQQIGNRILLEQPRVMLAWEVGCGKTKPVVDTAAHLIGEGTCDLCVVFTQSTIIDTWVRDAVPKDCDLKAAAITGTAVQRRAKLQQAYNDGVHFFVFNYDCVRVPDIVPMLKKIMTSDSILVFDESTDIKDYTTQRFRQLYYNLLLETKPRRVWLLSGTPITQSPEDIFGQAAMIDSRYFGKPTNFYAFKATYLVYNPHNKHHVVGYRNMDKYIGILHQFCHRVRKDDVLDLPPLVQQTVEFDLAPELRTIYDEFVDSEGVLTVNGAQLAIADNPLTKLMYAREIVNDWVYKMERSVNSLNEFTTKRTTIPLLGLTKNPKIEWLVEMLKTTHAHAIVWYAFNADKHMIQKSLLEAGITFVTMDGDVPQSQRQDLIEKFRRYEVEVFLGQPGAGGVGINLPEANVVANYNPIHSGFRRIQSIGRAYRLGQTRKVTVYDLIYRMTAEVGILENLLQKLDTARMIMDCSPEEFRNLLRGGIAA